MSNTFKKLYSGFDALYVAFAGAASLAVREQLADAKNEAGLSGVPQRVSIRGHEGHVKATGASGGYAFIFDEGELGLKILIKDHSDHENWNIFIEASAQCLVLNGLKKTKKLMFKMLKDFGVIVTGHSINRVDYAVDFETDSFELKPELFVAHQASTIKRYYEGCVSDYAGKRYKEEPEYISVIGGSKITSVTIGSMPNRQIIVYNKKKEVNSKRKLHWYKIWGVKKDECADIYRVEVRAGKTHLKDWNIVTFDDLENSIGTVFLDALKSIRYVETRDVSNISRAPLHDLWLNVIDIFTNKLWDFISNITRGRLIETMRSIREEMLATQCIGLSASLIATVKTELKGDELRRLVVSKLHRNLSRFLDKHWSDFTDKIQKSKDKIIYLNEMEIA